MTRSHLLHWPDGYHTRLVSVVQGQFEVSANPGVALTTVLGSCVSVCLYDTTTKVGGMNHYLLVGENSSDRESLKYGAYSMELLINGLLKKGACRSRLEAKVFGGSMMSGRFGHIGPKNAEFAENFLKNEGFPIVTKDTGGSHARRINFHPVTGKVRLLNTHENVREEPRSFTSDKPVMRPTPKPILFGNAS